MYYSKKKKINYLLIQPNKFNSVPIYLHGFFTVALQIVNLQQLSFKELLLEYITDHPFPDDAIF